MRIAFISYEYPPDTGFGGIATYTYQAAGMLRDRGHHVEVFAGSHSRSCTEMEKGILVHRHNEEDLETACEAIGHLFAKRHASARFDVLEGPELEAEGRAAIRLVPDIAFVVRLHSPSILLWKQNNPDGYTTSLSKKIRLYAQGILIGPRPSLQAFMKKDSSSGRGKDVSDQDAIERAHVLAADEIVAPSRAVIEKVTEEWGLQKNIWHVPNHYAPSGNLLGIPAATHTNVVTFIGRLEVLKGVMDLAQAIPMVLRERPGIRFRFIGGKYHSPMRGIEMRQYLEQFVLRRWKRSVEFRDAVAPDHIPELLAATDLCVFPSLWDNFPYVCLEAMAAGRGVVATDSGGMADMLDSGRVGRLVAPRKPEAIAQAVLELLNDSALRIRLGERSRARILSEYCADRIGPLQERVYESAIRRRSAIGKRIP
jgi:glycosyltransferase involved in cell wall biosynthesis